MHFNTSDLIGAAYDLCVVHGVSKSLSGAGTETLQTRQGAAHVTLTPNAVISW